MKNNKQKSPKKKATHSEENRWVDIHNDDVMREMGIIRPFVQSQRDPEVWTKTSYERQALRKAKSYCKKQDMHFHTIPREISRVRGKLVITLFKNKHFGKTTYSVECWEHEIPDILAQYQEVSKGYVNNIVRKYSWNGRTICSLSYR